MEETLGTDTKNLIEELKLKSAAAVIDQEENEDKNNSKKVYKDPTDGTEYEWDEEKRAWFPKVR